MTAPKRNMRLDTIKQIQTSRAKASQPLYGPPASHLMVSRSGAQGLSFKRRLMKAMTPLVFPLKLKATQRLHSNILPGWNLQLTTGYRFAEDWVRSRFASAAGSWHDKRVLVPGTNFNTREARDWFDRPIKTLHLLDIVDWGPSFAAGAENLQQLCKPSLQFHHGTLDQLPLPDESIDLMESRAVLEHVGNLADSAAEMARVLVPGGLALHGFGPLYFTHGGDHCIAAKGLQHGYDHLLLDDEEYVRSLMDEPTFERLGKEASDARYWAIQRIFSYLKPQEYLEAFAPWFDFELVLGIINEQALLFRSIKPDLWQQLLQAGLKESDLLIGSLTVILRKKTTF
jgi:SAM-dependent methyltransferase